MSGEGLPDLTLREVEKEDSLRVVGGIILETCLDPNETLKLELDAFELSYQGLYPEEFPEEINADYRNIEDSYDLCSHPTRLNNQRMNELRQTMQSYAEAHRE